MARESRPKGEVSDLKQKLAAVIAQGTSGNAAHKGDAKNAAHGAANNKDPATIKRNLFKNILHYMTINVDMSSLFTQMIIAATTTSAQDLVLKKMLYLYICTYAQQKPDLTLLAINTLTKDCGDSDPTIRGLALRSLCSLRVPNLVEYLLTPLKNGIGDRDAYVRRTAVLGVLKVLRLDPNSVDELGLEERLKDMMLNDPDAQVAANCLSVLRQMLKSRMGELVTKPTVYSLLNRLKEFSEWSQCLVLDFVSLYHPENADESFDIMNVLEDRLQHSDSAVVLATIKVFLHLTVDIPDVHQQVLERIKAPLYTQMHNSRSPEVSYVIASHLLVLVQRAPMLFSEDYKHFFCRHNDSIHVKKIKLEVLMLVADESNCYDIVNELCEYATDPIISIARESVKAVGTIAVNLCTCDGLVERLLSFLDMKVDHITSQAYIVIADILRSLPAQVDKCIEALAQIRSVEDVVEPEGRSAMAWILGSHGEKLQESPYILEDMVESFDGEDITVQLAILTACLKLFFKRPPECHKLVLDVLRKGMQNENQDVHDRALFYSRLLKQDLQSARDIVGGVSGDQQNGDSTFASMPFQDELSASPELAEALFREFNSLSVVYRQSASIFVAADDEITYEDDLYENQEEAATMAQDGGASAAMTADTNLLLDLSIDDVPPPSQQAPTAAPTMSLLDGLEDLARGDTSAFIGSDASTATSSMAASPTIVLQPSPSMEAAKFQHLWTSLQCQESFAINASALSSMKQAVMSLNTNLQMDGIHTMASGGQDPMFKLYQYAQLDDYAYPGGAGTVFLVEVVADTSAGRVSCLCKSDKPDFLKKFASFFEQKLKEHI